MTAVSTSFTRRLEIWADSFHEGRWVAEEIAKRFNGASVKYERGFIPILTATEEGKTLRIQVYGDYRAWDPIPDPIKSILQYGKPDFLLYAPDENRVIFIGEETAAVPTGNQSTQRCERMIGACLQKPPVPFAYLLPEYGLHRDGQARRSSVWPSMLAAKLMDQYSTTSVVLMFGDKDHLEDYSVGDGVNLLFELLVSYVREYVGFSEKSWKEQRRKSLEKARSLMLEFVKSQAASMLKVLPEYCHGKTSIDWPLSHGVPKTSTAFRSENLLRHDELLKNVYIKVSMPIRLTPTGTIGRIRSCRVLCLFKSRVVAAM